MGAGRQKDGLPRHLDRLSPAESVTRPALRLSCAAIETLTLQLGETLSTVEMLSSEILTRMAAMPTLGKSVLRKTNVRQKTNGLRQKTNGLRQKTNGLETNDSRKTNDSDCSGSWTGCDWLWSFRHCSGHHHRPGKFLRRPGRRRHRVPRHLRRRERRAQTRRYTS